VPQFSLSEYLNATMDFVFCFAVPLSFGFTISSNVWSAVADGEDFSEVVSPNVVAGLQNEHAPIMFTVLLVH
jgi:hypothetical protein